MKPKREIMAELRKRRKAEGLVELRLWVRPSVAAVVKEFAKKLSRGKLSRGKYSDINPTPDQMNIDPVKTPFYTRIKDNA